MFYERVLLRPMLGFDQQPISRNLRGTVGSAISGGANLQQGFPTTGIFNLKLGQDRAPQRRTGFVQGRRRCVSIGRRCDQLEG